jgi:hypothetical protein
MKHTQLKLSNPLDTCVRRIFSSDGVIRFNALFVRDIAGHRLPRLFVSFDPSNRIDSLLKSTVRRVDIDRVGLDISLA